MDKSTTLYVAFSIHGTRCFISASKTIDASSYFEEMKKLRRNGFCVAVSRRLNRNRGEVKLHWDKLTTKTEQPYKNPIWILRRFNELQNNFGFTIDETKKKNFIKKHF